MALEAGLCDEKWLFGEVVQARCGCVEIYSLVAGLMAQFHGGFQGLRQTA
jgi:hypothetical protein